jgi:hypothetical protein
MERYKPGYMGKVIPADDPSKLTDFVTNKYDAFSKVYDACKNSSDGIKDVISVETASGSSEFCMKISTDSTTIQSIIENKNDESVSVQGYVITAR